MLDTGHESRFDRNKSEVRTTSGRYSERTVFTIPFYRTECWKFVRTVIGPTKKKICRNESSGARNDHFRPVKIIVVRDTEENLRNYSGLTGEQMQTTIRT